MGYDLYDRVHRNQKAASFFSLNWLEPQTEAEGDVTALLAATAAR